MQADADHINKLLLDAAEKGDANTVVDCVIDSAGKGCDVNTVNEAGFSALMLAARSGHGHVVEELLELRANVHMQNRFGETALLLAAGYGGGSSDSNRIKIIKKLLDAGAYIDECDKSGNNTLSHLLRYIDIEKMKSSAISYRFLHEINGQDTHSCKLLKKMVHKRVVSIGATDIFVPYRAATNTRSKTILTFTESGYNRALYNLLNPSFAQQTCRTLQFLLRAAKK